ncbi:MAG: formylglycine-generating enzyme family protein, partial [bacterium]
YLFKTLNEKNEALRAGSPLDVALKVQGAAQVNGAYGALVKKALTPEVVKHGGLQIGRFEVTRAQWAAFDRKYKIPPGTENYPVTGIGFEQAVAYAGWLSKLTGATYRLLTEDEGDDLYASGGDKENTLDYWAGYDVNPDDAARLAAEVAKLGPGALLRPVGSFSPFSDEELIFDIGGNAAEWVVTSDGTGKAMGASADTSSDSKSADRKPAPDYIGFRIAKAG